jgi:CRISPR/Cas system type I-B associated protein Csh2 (Cas7 group RAMP superfamily)
MAYLNSNPNPLATNRPRRGGGGKLTLGMQDRRRKAKKRNYVFVLEGTDNAFYDDVVALAEDFQVVKLGSAAGK